ncbi:MAG: GNAT family N-acetyltransferase [Deltaproteobacteria bacterium]|nr:GNAT family N-acetyltransferase [Deltaproteobacteria bacterium]MBW1961034.1 GNAT family N-acetyltransferase [Deltaproteobacteria bacterium]MBW1995609.1 GNAT family N-acetyltransferase [Deltaproteobacteria bacterium]MBW2153363.1 GNAT family N-acetyltransferase [Deltaproteobacteria bacterium]
MLTPKVDIRPLHAGDFDAVVEIDARVYGTSRPEYYETKFARALNQKNRMVTSLVAEIEGKVVGFVMSELFVGEYGIPDSDATLDTIGIHPDYQRKGIGRQLMEEFINHLRKAGVVRLNTLVGWNDWRLIRFFSTNGFVPSKVINLELNLV